MEDNEIVHSDRHLVKLLCDQSHTFGIMGRIVNIQNEIRPRALQAMDRNDKEATAEARAALSMLAFLYQSLQLEFDHLKKQISAEADARDMDESEVADMRDVLGLGGLAAE